jgi:hypothetical protein
MLDDLHDELTPMGIDWRARNIVFHGWRHFYAARMADIEAADKVSRITGHKSRAVFDAYADHVTEGLLEYSPGGKLRSLHLRPSTTRSQGFRSGFFNIRLFGLPIGSRTAGRIMITIFRPPLASYPQPSSCHTTGV